MLTSGVLDVEAFDTEPYFDLLTINDDTFSDVFGPNGVAVKQGTSITWASDHSSTHRGFKVCVVVVPSSGPTPSPSFSTVTTSPTLAVVSVLSGPCSVAGGACLLSPNYPGFYGNSQFCEASIAHITILKIYSVHSCPIKTFAAFLSSAC
jgi:hypothetical protein